MRGKNQSIHEYAAERVGLAETYAQDGAFYSAARVLRELADEVERHARETDPVSVQYQLLQRLPEDEEEISG